MVIKSNASNTQAIILCYLVSILVFIVFCSLSTYYIAAAMFLLILTYSTCYWIATGKTLVFDKSGCTVSFLWYRRAYTWDELKTKQYKTYKTSSRYPYSRGAVFSAKLIHCPNWLRPDRYCMFVHPLSFLFVYFRPENLPNTADKLNPMLYVTEESYFRDKLTEWNVEMRNSDDSPA